MQKAVRLFSIVVFITAAYAEQPSFPVIDTLSSDNYLFQQYCDDVLQARKALAEGHAAERLPLHFYAYKAKHDDTIIKIAARCSIPYDALITLNEIETIKTPIAGKLLVLPTLPGIYIPEAAVSDMQHLIEAFCSKMKIEPLMFKLPAIDDPKKKTLYQCFPNVLLDGTVRSFFFTPFYRLPLKKAVLTSPFGMRASPFTGKAAYHPGIDLAAPTGTPVYACTSGCVTGIAYSKIYGNHIIIRHDDGRESLYGHLSEVKIRLYQTVKAGTIIGNVGSTGMSTGPHLHFEIREKGSAKDPALFINTKK